MSISPSFVSTANGEIAYFGKKEFPDRPTVTLLHGLSSNHTTWDNLAQELRGQKYNVIVPDLRGHGFSDKTRKQSIYRPEVMAEDVSLILEREGVKKCFFVGYSLGGTIALQIALQYPDLAQGLVIVSANHTSPLRYWHIYLLTYIAAPLVALASYLLIWQKRKRYFQYRHGEAKGYWDSVWNGLKTMPLSVNLWLFLMMGLVDLRKKIFAIKIPVCLVRSHSDPLVTAKEAQEMLSAMPHASMVRPEHKGHFVASESQEEVRDIVLRFIKEHENSHI